jgi:hypothetical protein
VLIKPRIESFCAIARKQIFNVLGAAGAKIVSDFLGAMFSWLVGTVGVFLSPEERQVFLWQKKHAVCEDALEEEGGQGLVLKGGANVCGPLDEIAFVVEPCG